MKQITTVSSTSAELQAIGEPQIVEGSLGSVVDQALKAVDAKVAVVVDMSAGGGAANVKVYDTAQGLVLSRMDLTPNDPTKKVSTYTGAPGPGGAPSGADTEVAAILANQPPSFSAASLVNEVEKALDAGTGTIEVLVVSQFDGQIHAVTVPPTPPAGTLLAEYDIAPAPSGAAGPRNPFE